jgi:hypothetical protein
VSRRLLIASFAQGPGEGGPLFFILSEQPFRSPLRDPAYRMSRKAFASIDFSPVWQTSALWFEDARTMYQTRDRLRHLFSGAAKGTMHVGPEQNVEHAANLPDAPLIAASRHPKGRLCRALGILLGERRWE